MTADKELTREQIEALRGQIGNDFDGAITLSDKHMNALCDMALRSLAPLSATAAMPERKVVSSLYGTKEFYEATGWNACVDAVRLAAAPAPATGAEAVAEVIDAEDADFGDMRILFIRSKASLPAGTELYAAPTSPVVEEGAIPEEVVKQQEALMHPATQVFFRAGLLACREYMARFVEPQDAGIAASIRANWWPSLGQDFGPPRLNDWSEFTEGEYGTDSFRCKTVDEVSPTQEALPIAAQFLEACRSSSMKPSEGGK